MRISWDFGRTPFSRAPSAYRWVSLRLGRHAYVLRLHGDWKISWSHWRNAY